MASRRRDSEDPGARPADRAAAGEIDESLRKALRAVVNHENIDSAIDLLNGLERQREDMTTRVALDARKRLFEDREKLRRELEQLVEERTRREPESDRRRGLPEVVLDAARWATPVLLIVVVLVAIWLALSVVRVQGELEALSTTQGMAIGSIASGTASGSEPIQSGSAQANEAQPTNEFFEAELERLQRELSDSRERSARLEKRLMRLERERS